MSDNGSGYILGLGDDALIYSHRLGQWLTWAPAFEEDMALANVSLDLLGQARALLTHAGDLLADADGSAVALFTESALVRPLGDRLHLRLEFDADYTSGLSARDGWNFWWGAAIGMRF